MKNDDTGSHALLQELEQCLRDERAAVARLELRALEPIAARKERVCAKLAAVTIPRGLAAAARRVFLLAEANAALLASSAEAVAELIAPPAPAVYDARGLMRRGAAAARLRTRRI